MLKKILLSIVITFSVSTLAAENVSLLFLGDMMFDRGVAVTARKNGFDYVFGPATTTIAAHDITIANLEGPVTSYKSKLILDNGKAISGFQFTFSPATAPAVKKAGIDIVSLANNHTDNFGQAGLDQTRTYLKNNALQYFGSPINNIDLMATTTCMKDLCVGLIGWHEFSYRGDANVVKKIKEFKTQGLDYIVVYPHWGVEYKKTPSKRQVQLARAWLDAGADAVIGSHPHVIQTVEKYKDKYIFYSLGNFIFDQYFSFDTTHGMGISINLSKGKKPEYQIVPFTNVGNKVSLPTAEEVLKMFKGIDLGGVMVR